MARPRNPLSKRNRNATFTGAEVSRILEKLAASKKARVVRRRGEFNADVLATLVRPPLVNAGAFSWPLDAILSARDAQMSGVFAAPARLAESFNTDDAIFTARSVRLAPVQSLSVRIKAGSGPQAAMIRTEAEALFGDKGIAWSSDTENTVRQQLVDHGVAFAAITWQPRADGTRHDLVINAWPIEFVKWDSIANCYVTRVRRPDSDPDPTAANLHPSVALTEAGLEPIIHGNGRWIVFKKSELLPHRSADATLLPAALVWPCHAFANRDWRKGSAVAGNAKVVGELPEGDALTDENGNPTDEANAFLQLLQALASQDSPFGIRPAGAKTEILANPSASAWEVFAKLSESSERAAARIYLGTDGVLGAQGGAPGVDISALFGVATSKVQSDLSCIARGLQSGAISPWCARNFDDDRQAPTREYVFPDPDLSRTREDFGKRNAAFLAALKAAKDAGYQLTPEYTKKLADEYGVPVPVLADVSPQAPAAAAPAG